MSTAEQLLTAQEYLRLPDKPDYSELVRGVIISMTPPGFRHCKICARTSYLLQRYLEDHDLGRVISNDGGIITQRDPDTVRGGDVSFYSYERCGAMLALWDTPPLRRTLCLKCVRLMTVGATFTRKSRNICRRGWRSCVSSFPKLPPPICSMPISPAKSAKAMKNSPCPLRWMSSGNPSRHFLPARDDTPLHSFVPSLT